MEKTGKLIAVVDDEEDILELVSLHLEKAGYRAKNFLNPKSFLKSIIWAWILTIPCSAVISAVSYDIIHKI